MFIFSLLTFLYGVMCCLIILLVLIQRGKSSMGLGNMGGNNQMLFGSSGGQDIFQTATWILCGILLVGSLFLSTLKSKYGKSHTSVNYTRNVPVDNNQNTDSAE